MYKELNILNITPGKYLINESGDIYSTYRNRLLHPILNKDGYYKICLCTNEYSSDKNNIHKRRTFFIHTLVMLVFNGAAPSDMNDPTVDHIDHDRLNNNHDNLRWLERSENTKLRSTLPTGEANGSAVLTELQVIEICELLCTGLASLPDIAAIYHTSKSAISNIRRKKTWKHISTKYNFAPPCNSANNRKHYVKSTQF